MGLRRRTTLWEEQRGRREAAWFLHGSVLLAGMKAARTALIPARLKLWPNQA